MTRVHPDAIPDGGLVFIGSIGGHWLPQIWRRTGDMAVHVFSTDEAQPAADVKVSYLAENQSIWWCRPATQEDLDCAQAMRALLPHDQYEQAYKKLAEGE